MVSFVDPQATAVAGVDQGSVVRASPVPDQALPPDEHLSLHRKNASLMRFAPPSSPGRRIIPEDVRSLQRDNRSFALGDQPWSVVRSGANGRSASVVHEGIHGADEAVATFHGLPHSRMPLAAFGVKLDAHAVRIEMVEKCLNLKHVFLSAVFNRRRTEEELRRVLFASR